MSDLLTTFISLFRQYWMYALVVTGVILAIAAFNYYRKGGEKAPEEIVTEYPEVKPTVYERQINSLSKSVALLTQSINQMNNNIGNQFAAQSQEITKQSQRLSQLENNGQEELKKVPIRDLMMTKIKQGIQDGTIKLRMPVITLKIDDDTYEVPLEEEPETTLPTSTTPITDDPKPSENTPLVPPVPEPTLLEEGETEDGEFSFSTENLEEIKRNLRLPQ